ncbi:uncharacterized protein LOC133531281 [Cydia pomonella]|uniref:uncharacterized protein LOC133531281 n=1 Tax=Cydia pomonella TaxID=82600 RepID=UPI002ADD447B|nr:uncharacterized protein LOC133531281 [Cydia pomonella]
MSHLINNKGLLCAAGCKDIITDMKDVLQCTSETCQKIFHRLCITSKNLSTTEKTSWTCPGCKAASKKGGDNSATPVRNQLVDNVTVRKKTIQQPQKSIEPPGAQSPATLETKIQSCSVTGESESSLVRELQLFRLELAGMRQELSSMNINLEKLSNTVSGLDDRLTSLEQRVQVLEDQPAQPDDVHNDIKGLMDTVDRLKLELNDRDQELLATEVEITGIVETSNESPVHLAVLVAQKLGVEMESKDVVSAERVGMKRGPNDADSSEGSDGSAGRPRALVVRLARRFHRDNLLRAARRARGADTSGFDLPGPPRRFYVNERLTRTNRQLFYKARHEGSRLNWRYIWTRDGRIYARRQPNTQSHRVRSEDDLIKIFGVQSVCL